MLPDERLSHSLPKFPRSPTLRYYHNYKDLYGNSSSKFYRQELKLFCDKCLNFNNNNNNNNHNNHNNHNLILILQKLNMDMSTCASHINSVVSSFLFCGDLRLFQRVGQTFSFNIVLKEHAVDLLAASHCIQRKWLPIVRCLIKQCLPV